MRHEPLTLNPKPDAIPFLPLTISILHEPLYITKPREPYQRQYLPSLQNHAVQTLATHADTLLIVCKNFKDMGVACAFDLRWQEVWVWDESTPRSVEFTNCRWNLRSKCWAQNKLFCLWLEAKHVRCHDFECQSQHAQSVSARQTLPSKFTSNNTRTTQDIVRTWLKCHWRGGSMNRGPQNGR